MNKISFKRVHAFQEIKSKFLFPLLLFLLTAISATTYAQRNPLLDSFTISETNGEVYLSWSIVAGGTCNGISILRSDDSLNFFEIGNIPGVCGSSSSVANYSFTDVNPQKNAINYYRLELGFANYSQILAIEIIDIENSGYQLRPNPSAAFTTLYFENLKRQEYQFELYNLNGLVVMSFLTRDNFIPINSSLLASGLYFFTLTLPGNLPKVKGKMMVE